VSGNLRVTGAFYDSSNSPGSSGRVLGSTGTGTTWIDLCSAIAECEGTGATELIGGWDTDSVTYQGGTQKRTYTKTESTLVGIGTFEPSAPLSIVCNPGYESGGSFQSAMEVRVSEVFTDRRSAEFQGGLGIFVKNTSGPRAGEFDGVVFAQEFSQGSDRKLKSDIQPYHDALDAVSRLQVKSYRFRKDEFAFMNLPSGVRVGLLADELEAVFPELVMQNNYPLSKEWQRQLGSATFDFKGVNYIELIPVLIRAIQEQQSIIDSNSQKHQLQIDALLKRIEQLESNNAND
jgi:hypothetical protein